MKVSYATGHCRYEARVDAEIVKSTLNVDYNKQNQPETKVGLYTRGEVIRYKVTEII